MAKQSDSFWDPHLTAAQNAKRRLPKLASDYFNAGSKLVEGKPTVEELHAFRLATKRFRFTLEMFRPCYGKSLEIRIEHLRGVQNRLGEINDCVTTLALLKPAAKSKAVSAFLKKRITERTRAFVQHWHRTFDAGQEIQWRRYLSSFAREESSSRGKRR